MADQMDGKGRPPKRRSRLTRGQKGLIAAAAVLAVALAGVLAWQSLFVRPDLNAGKTEPQETEEPTDPVEEIDWGEGTRPRSDGERKSQDYYTVLILGRDTGGGGNTDTMLLASYDVTNQKATVMSIPRDTMVNVSWDIKKINSVYNTYGGGDRGIQALYKEISQLVGFEPDYQVIIEWEAVGEIVDAMGGVWFDVPRNMNYDDPLQNLHIHQEKGYRLLTGEDAMEVLRYRHDNRKNGVTLGYPEGDVGRIKTQQAFLKAMVEQLLKVENVPKVRQFIQVFQDNVETNLTFQNILWFAQAAFLGGLKAENVEFVTMPGNSSAYAYSASISRANGEYSEASYVTPYPNELLELVNTRLSPYKEVFTRSDLDMMTVNADGSVSSSTGHLEDPSAANPRSYWQAQWTPQEPEEETPPEGETGTGTDPDAGAPETGGETGTPGGGEITDPGGAMDPGTGIIDPDTGDLIDPETGGIIDPGTGQILDPGTGQVIGQIPGGSGDPAAGESGGTAPETPDAQPPAGETAPGDPSASDGGTAAPDDGFIIVS
ncbi:LCP family protein [Oscillibacter sp.]|uniref:LCP family protein n=2 Tax=Oscillibacter TaxID=459786 RepID=UPI002D7E1AFC|nr:LCP family protein [Oscillibacter sp.]MBS6355193.1 LCP family protein [Oscillibacter sp.]